MKSFLIFLILNTIFIQNTKALLIKECGVYSFRGWLECNDKSCEVTTYKNQRSETKFKFFNVNRKYFEFSNESVEFNAHIKKLENKNIVPISNAPKPILLTKFTKGVSLKEKGRCE